MCCYATRLIQFQNILVQFVLIFINLERFGTTLVSVGYLLHRGNRHQNTKIIQYEHAKKQIVRYLRVVAHGNCLTLGNCSK